MDAKTIAIAAVKIKRRFCKPPDEPAPAEVPTDIIEARAARVRDLVKAYFGEVCFRSGNRMVVEVPADLAPNVPWMAQFVPIFTGQRTGSAERRVVGMNGQFVVCPNDFVTQNYFRYEIDLTPRSAPVADTADVARAITAPTRAG